MQARVERGEPTPMWDARPLVFEDLEWAWSAWQALSGSRQITMGGAGPIGFEAIDRYAARYGIVGDEFEELREYVSAMDAAYLAHGKDEAKPPKE